MKQKNLLLMLASFVMLASLFQSCKKDDDKFESSATTLSFEAEKGSKTFTITSNVDWSISSNAAWCTVSPTSGNGNATITVTVTEYDGTSESRPAVITLSPSGLPKHTIAVTQLPTGVKPATKGETTITATAWNTWNYFSLAEGKIIGTGDATEESDAEWRNRKDWDFAFTRICARTNSGASGDGNGGVIEIAANEIDKAAAFSNLTVAPTTGYIEDASEEIMIGMGAGGPVYYTAGASSTINAWLTVAMPVVATPKVFALKTGDGKYAKIHLKSYHNDLGESGFINIEYSYQADGTTNLAN